MAATFMTIKNNDATKYDESPKIRQRAEYLIIKKMVFTSAPNTNKNSSAL